MKMHEKKLKKFNIYKKIANILFVFTLVFGVILILASTVGQLYLANNDIDITQEATKFLEREALPVRILDGFIIPNGFFVLLTVYGIFSLGLMAYLIKAVANLFSSVVENKTPFTHRVVKLLKSMGIAFFVYTLIMFILSGVLSAVLVGTAEIGLSDIEIKYILLGILLFTLGEIFEFGMGLQHDSESIV